MMDIYGKYVWAAYGVTFVVFLINLIVILREKQQVNKMLKQNRIHESQTKN